MPEEYLIEYASPTLAGLKTGSLFMIPCGLLRSPEAEVREMARRLSTKGIGIRFLGIVRGRARVYLYRPDRLERDLAHPTAVHILGERGYPLGSVEGCLDRLAQRMAAEDDFPHEVGLFLGYPAEDVHGFIHHRTEGLKKVGCWCVYGDEKAAEKTFLLYEKCTRIYREQLAKGRSLENLTVAYMKGR